MNEMISFLKLNTPLFN